MSSRGPLTRRQNDVAIVAGTTPFVITCKEAQAYTRWERSLRDAVAVYPTWTSFRRSENVMEYFKQYVGDGLRFLKGKEGAKNDQEAEWQLMTEVETMKISKDSFHAIEKASRHVAAWHGVTVQKIIRRDTDVAFLPGNSDFAKECRGTRSFALFEEAIKKAVQVYKKSWTNFRRSGGVLGYFQQEMGEETRLLRAKNESATCEDEANWEELSGEPLTSFMENKFAYYACLAEDPSDDTKVVGAAAVAETTNESSADEKIKSVPASGRASLTKRRKSAAPEPPAPPAPDTNANTKADQGDEKPSFFTNANPPQNDDQDEDAIVVTEKIAPTKTKKRKSAVASTLHSSDNDEGKEDESLSLGQKAPKRAKASVPMPVSKPRDVPRTEYKPKKSDPETDPEYRGHHVTCSIFLLSKALAMVLGRIDVKVKTRWTLDRLRKEIDPVLRQKRYLTMNAPWEFYFYESGSFVSQKYEDSLRIGDYLMEANQENSISIRVV